MADFKTHCNECKKVLGDEWVCVHRWLDKFAWKTWPSHSHRAYRHHIEGVEQIRKMWGNEAAKAAELHIRTDFEFLGWAHIPSQRELEEYYCLN